MALPPCQLVPCTEGGSTQQGKGRRGQESNGMAADKSSHQGFHSGGNGATMPSLASHISSGSFSGSIPISRAKSWISRKTGEESVETVYIRRYTIKPTSSAKGMGTLGNPDPGTKLLTAASMAPRVSRGCPTRLVKQGDRLQNGIYLCNQKANFSLSVFHEISLTLPCPPMLSEN